MSWIVELLKWVSIAALVVTPASLVIIQSCENGDNPWRHPPTIFKCFAAWWLGLTGSLLLAFVFPPAFFGLPAFMGWLFDLFFERGFWRGCWWTILTWGLLVVVLIVGGTLYSFGRSIVS